MQPALHITTKVLPGNKIEVEIPEAEVGDSVDVFVILPEKVETKKRSVIQILEEVHAQLPPGSVEEIDKYLQQERESWDS